jgi:hypothetical protein
MVSVSVTLLTSAFGAQAHTCCLDHYPFHCDACPLCQQWHLMLSSKQNVDWCLWANNFDAQVLTLLLEVEQSFCHYMPTMKQQNSNTSSHSKP